MRQQLLRGIHDEHALDVQAQAGALVALQHQVHRRRPRHVQQRGVALAALDLVVRPAQGVFEVVAQVLVERLVFLIRDVRLRQGPQRRSLVDVLPFRFLLFVFFLHPDREADVI